MAGASGQHGAPWRPRDGFGNGSVLPLPLAGEGWGGAMAPVNSPTRRALPRASTSPQAGEVLKLAARIDSTSRDHPLASGGRPLRDKTFRLVWLDLIPFAENPDPESRIGVPERQRRVEAIDSDQHLLHLRPVPVQRHRVAARRPGVAEADHAADIRQAQRGFDNGQREHDVLPRATMAALMISHSESFEPGVTPPLTIDQRNKPSRQSLKASSTRRATSSRVPNTNSRSAGLIGVLIKCLALMSAISRSVGSRVCRSSTVRLAS